MEQVVSMVTTAITIIHYIHAPILVFLFFIVVRCTSRSTDSTQRAFHKKRVSLVFMLLIIFTYVLQSILYLQRAIIQKGWWAPQHSIVHVIGSMFAWTYLNFILLTTEPPAWHAYLALWFLDFVFEITLYVLATASPSADDDYRHIWEALHAIRLGAAAILVANGSLLSLRNEAKESSDEERRPLLDSEPIHRPGDDEEDGNKQFREQQRKRLEEEGWIGYLKSFGIFLPFIWPRDSFKTKLCAVLLIMNLTADRAFRVLIPRQIGIITNKLAAETSPRTVPWQEILMWMFFLLLEGEAGLASLKKFALLEIRNQSHTRISKLALSHVLGLSADFHDKKASGEVVKSVEQADSMTELLELVLLDIAPIIIDLLIAMLYVTYLFDIYLALSIFSVGTAFVWTGISFTAWASQRRRKYAEKSRLESNVVYESISNWQTVSIFSRAKYEEQRYGIAIQDSIDAKFAYLSTAYLGYGVQSLIVTMGFLCCCLLTAQQVILEVKPIGNFVTFTLYWGMMISPLQTIAWSYQSLTSTLIDAERFLQLLRTSPSVKEQEGCDELRVDHGKVQFRNVSFTYESQKKEAVKEVNLEVLPGTTVAFVGESGGGKSTLFGLILRLFDPTEGSITIDGQELNSVSLNSLREAIGVVPQDPALFNRSILENIQYANPNASYEEVEQACKAAAIHEKIMSLPERYNTTVGERGVQLSGGQRQRIAIARVLVKRPKIVLLDEATSAVDSLTEEKIQEAFKNLGTGRTMFIIAHRLSTILSADQIVVLDKGEIVERGSHQELLRKGGKYFKLWDNQTKTKSN